MPTPPRCVVRSGLLVLFAVAACDSGGRTEPAPAPETARLLVTADTEVLAASAAPASPAATAAFAAAIDAGGRPVAHYVLTTPAGEAFSFDLLSWREGAAGAAAVHVAHLRDGDADVDRIGDPASLPAVGIAPQGLALAADNGWIGAAGDGLARISLKGRIERDQVLGAETEDGALALIELRIGDRSRINRPVGGGDAPTDVVTTRTIYSSASQWFGMPTLAVSGDRTSIVCYEGDREAEFADSRFELRLQHEAATDTVTGGGTIATEAAGYWRDHEIAALHNVLVVARAEAATLRLRLSFDRGATFAQEVELPTGAAQTRLVQVAFAADYSLAVGCWRREPLSGSQQFVLVEGRPAAADGTGSPTWFSFDAPQVVHEIAFDGTPLTTGIAWSDGGDLVVGYGATTFTNVPTGGWLTRTEFRCAVRRYGEELQDRLVDAEEIFGMDPTVAVLGSGASLRIFYAYEARDGLRLAHSDDGGASFTIGGAFGQPGDHLPAVFAREVGGAVRLDVLYLASRDEGVELHHARWLDGPSSPRVDFALTDAVLETGSPSPALWWGGATVPITQGGWLGFDAGLDRAALGAGYDEHTRDAAVGCWGGMAWTTTTTALPPIFASPGSFTAAAPPPLAPGMTEAVAPPNAAHAHQLKLLRIE